MGLLAAVKENKVGAVVVSVFDWYRRLSFSLLIGDAESDCAASHYPKEERKLLRKLDLAILIFGSLSCKWKYDTERLLQPR